MEQKKKILAPVSKNFADLPPRVTIRQEVQVGVPYKRIVEKAATEGADLIIMSTHGRTGLSHVLIGSVTEKVVQHASCPVLSIRPHEEPRHQEAVAL
ncbi:MAG: universal stress protein [Deltaproteobacteria bacterium]|nr:universal stress protein [Deltaproteobacteria bacterium]